MTPVIFKVYICQGPKPHFINMRVAPALVEALRCEYCRAPVDEVEVVRVDDLSDEEVPNEAVPRTQTYTESDVPKWKLERFREWLHRSDADSEPDMLVGRAVRGEF
jgi:hypothetical protein